MASEQQIHRQRRARRLHRIRTVIRGTVERPRLAVFRSLKHVSAQVINDTTGRTLAAANDREVDVKVRGVARAAAVGALIAERARAKGVAVVVFDRRHYRYHGQVKAVAEAARSAGLEF